MSFSRLAWVLIGIVMVLPMSTARGADASAKVSTHLTPTDRIRDLLEHPAFAPHGRLLLPWDGRRYDEAMRLADVGSLLPYHSHVDTEIVVGALNRMIDDVAAGKTVFHDFYAESEKKSDPSKRNTGLLFFRGKAGAPFALIASGGGFEYVGSLHEGFPYAAEISKRGYNAFVLKYRAGAGAAVATEDMARALSYIFRTASALEVGTTSYSLWGSSAGARMAAAIGSHGTARFGGDRLPKPSVVVMAYTGHADYASSEPATFVVVGEDDGIAPPATMERRVRALRSLGTDVEFLRFPNVGHGFGVGNGTSAKGWIGNATRFWEQHMEKTR
jgi:acetyl esterase/lipase